MTEQNWKVVFEAERCPLRQDSGAGIRGTSPDKCLYSGRYCATEEKDCPARMFSQFEGDEGKLIELQVKKMEEGNKKYGALHIDKDAREALPEGMAESLDLNNYLAWALVDITKYAKFLEEDRDCFKRYFNKASDALDAMTKMYNKLLYKYNELKEESNVKT